MFSIANSLQSFRARPCVCVAAVLSACLAAGCSGGNDQTVQDSQASASQTPAASAEPGAQNVSGRAATIAGYPSIVVLEPIGGDPLPPQTTPPAMDQEQQTFIPPILLVRTGEPVDFLNHDDVLHNVRVKNEETKESAFNVAIPTGEKYTHTFERDGFYDVGCDIHPGMTAQILASSSPYSVIADPSGAFTISNVPDGPYKATAYVGAREVTREINVTAGTTTIDLTE
jgi:plastocyanin